MRSTRQDILESLPKGSVGAEIGVAGAVFSAKMLEIVRPRILYLVDRWGLIENKKARPAKALCLEEAMERIAEAVARGIARPICAFSVQAARWVPDNALDWVYIDANHSTASCLEDLRVWYPKVKAGGLISGHDYRPDRGPYTAVATFVQETPGLSLADVGRTKDAKEVESFYFRKPNG